MKDYAPMRKKTAIVTTGEWAREQWGVSRSRDVRGGVVGMG